MKSTYYFGLYRYVKLTFLLIFLFSLCVSCSRRHDKQSEEKISTECEAARKILSEMNGLPDGPVLLLAWPKGKASGYMEARKETIVEGLKNSHEIIIAGAYVPSMKVPRDFVRLDPLSLADDLRAYIDSNDSLVAVVALFELSGMESFEGMKSPPFFIYTGSYNWESLMDEGLVKGVIYGLERTVVKESSQEPYKFFRSNL